MIYAMLFVAAFYVGTGTAWYAWAADAQAVNTSGRLDAQGWAVIIGAFFSGVAMLFGMWATYQNSKTKADNARLEAKTDNIGLKTDEVVTQQKTLTGQMDGMKDALVKSERAVAKTEGREEIITEQKAEAATKALGLAEGTAAKAAGEKSVDVVAPPRSG